MMNTSGSRRISSAMASRRASRTVCVTIRVPAGIAGSAGTGIETAAGGGGAATAATASLVAAGVLSSSAAVAAAARAPASSPSSRRMAMGAPTGTFSVPSATRMRPSVPSSTASTSIVALSVSISAMTSPGATGSPSFLSQRAKVPDSIVGESAGMAMVIGIGRALLRPRRERLHGAFRAQAPAHCGQSRPPPRSPP